MACKAAPEPRKGSNHDLVLAGSDKDRGTREKTIAKWGARPDQLAVGRELIRFQTLLSRPSARASHPDRGTDSVSKNEPEWTEMPSKAAPEPRKCFIHDLVLAGSDKDRGTLQKAIAKWGAPPRSACCRAGID